MSYIGRQLNNLSDRVKLDSITTSATATYNLLLNGVAYVPSSAESLTVSLNGILQAPQDSYTVSSSTITFASALTSSDSIDFILAERSITLQTPSAGSVGLSQLSATGTKDATTFLRGDNTFATAGADADNYFATSGLSSKDLGVGLHIKTADSGASVGVAADELVIEGSGNSGMSILSGTSHIGGIYLGDSGDVDIGKVEYDHSDNSMRFTTNNSERMRILSSGVVKVNSRMIIDAEVSNVAKISSEFGANNEMGISFNDKDSASNGRFIEFKRGGTEIGQIKRDGTNDAISYVTSSDYRLKDGIVDKTDGIEKVKQLQPRKFYWLSNPNQTLVDGFIAHEVSDVVPEAISGEKDATETYTNENGDEQTRIIPQGIDQSKLVPLLTAALKEAITKIETLEAKVEALENA